MIDGVAQWLEECKGGTEGAWCSSFHKLVGSVLGSLRPLLASLDGLLW